MPNVDGFEATRQIMETRPTPIVIVSGSEIQAEIDASFRAVEAGALVIVQRPCSPGNAAYNQTAQALIRTVKAMAEVRVVRRWPKEARHNARKVIVKAAPPQKQAYKLVLLGASTGGPTVLRDILAELPPDYALPIVIVQHMSAGFIGGFVEWLSSASGFPVRLAAHGEQLVGRCAYLAPDGFHIAVTRDLRIALSSDRPEHGMCPSVSYLFRSIHKDLRSGTVAVQLTGMGKDGAQELRQLKDSGAVTIVQDRATSAVYGMPGEAIRHDAARLILAPAEIGRILRVLGKEHVPGLPFLQD
jgi:two-component system, chemotaxis family, protein-glutamate methylesterase/glutaminase